MDQSRSELRPFGAYAVTEPIEAVEAVGDHLDEGSVDVTVEANTAQQIPVRRVDVAVQGSRRSRYRAKRCGRKTGERSPDRSFAPRPRS